MGSRNRCKWKSETRDVLPRTRIRSTGYRFNICVYISKCRRHQADLSQPESIHQIHSQAEGFRMHYFFPTRNGPRKKIYLSCTAARNKWRSRRSNGHSSSSMVLEEMKKRRNMARVCHGYVNNLETNGKITFHSVQQSHLRKNCRYNWVMNTIFFWILVRRSSVIDFDVSKSAETWLIFFSILNLMYNPLMLGNQEKLWKVMKKF